MIDGTSSNKIALLVPDLPTREELGPFLDRIDIAHWYTNFGPLVRELESEMEQRLSIGAPERQHVVTVSNATIGLELALLALELEAGSRVLIPALTFVASAAAVIRAGCVPVFCDVEEDTWLLSPRIAAEAMRKIRVDAVMPVSTYGCPQSAAAWDEFSESTGVPVVIDAAGAYGNQDAGSKCILVFSLHATKTFAAAEGGLVVAANDSYVSRVRVLSNFGIDPSADTGPASGSGGLVSIAGTNGKLSEYHAALALAALQRWPDIRARRIALHQQYVKTIGATCPSLTLQTRSIDGVYFVLPVLTPGGRSAVEAWGYLSRLGIQTRRWYCPPLNMNPAFAQMPVAGSILVAHDLGERLIALPFHLFLSADDVGTVAEAMAGFLSVGE